MWQFAARLQELNNILPKFPGSEKSKKISQEGINDILLNAVPQGWDNQAMVLVFDFESKYFRDKQELFKIMEAVESIYEGSGATYQAKKNRADEKRVGEYII